MDCGKIAAIIFFIILLPLLVVTEKPKQEQNYDIKFKSVKDYLNYLNNRTTTPFNYTRPDFLDKEKYPLPSIKDIINSPQQEVGILTKDRNSYNAGFQPSNEESKNNLTNKENFSESDSESKNLPSNIPPNQLSAPTNIGITQ